MRFNLANETSFFPGKMDMDYRAMHLIPLLVLSE